MVEGADPEEDGAEMGCRVWLGKLVLTQMCVIFPETARGQ